MRLAGPLFVAAVVGLLCGGARAETVGRLASVQGGVKLVRGSATFEARVGLDVALGDLVKTGAEGRAKLLFKDGSVLNIGDDTRLRITRFLYDPKGGERDGALELLRGTVRAWVTKMRMRKNRFEVQTPTAVAGVRGTSWAIRETKKLGAQIVVFGGEVFVRSSLGYAGECLAREGMSCLVRPGQGPGPATKTLPALDRQFRGSTRVASRLQFEGRRLAGLLLPRIDRMGSFQPRFSRIRGRQGGVPTRAASRREGNLPGAGNFADTVTPGQYLPVQVQARTRTNY